MLQLIRDQTARSKTWSNAGGGREVIIIHASDTEVGGIVAATLFYAMALIAAGHPAEIWTGSKALVRRAQLLGVPIFYHKWFINAGIAAIHPTLIRKAVRARNAQAVIHQGEKLWLFGRIWLRRQQESVVFHNEKIGQRRYFKQWLVLSNRNRDRLESYARDRRLPRQISLIRNGPLPDASVPRLVGTASRTATIGASSNFRHHKGMDVLIRAFGKTRGNGRDVKLVLAGDGPERQACMALAASLEIGHCVKWLGWLSDTKPFYAQIDLFCLPSRQEPFGIVVTEAMQACLPCIVTDTSGPRDIIEDGRSGWVVPAGDADALAAALTEAIDDPKRAAAIARGGYERYRSFYSAEAAGISLAEAIGLTPHGEP